MIEGVLVAGIFNPGPLLTRQPTAPLFEQVLRLERPVIATYIVKGREDLWSLCKRFHVDQFSIRSSNDLDVSVFDDGTALKIPSQKGTLYQVDKPENLHSIIQTNAHGKILAAGYH